MQCSMRRPDQAPRSSFPIFHIYLSKLEHKAKYYLQYISKYFIFISTPPPFCTSAVSVPPPGCPTIVSWRQTQAGNCYKYNNGHVSHVSCVTCPTPATCRRVTRPPSWTWRWSWFGGGRTESTPPRPPRCRPPPAPRTHPPPRSSQDSPGLQSSAKFSHDPPCCFLAKYL